MATKLKNLKIRKVDFVDEGANPDAHIRMLKRKDADVQTAGDGCRSGTGSILKKMLGFIGKAAGMDQEEIDSAVDEIQKGDSESFNEKIAEVKNRQIADEMWDTCYALQSSLCSILNDEDMDSTGATMAMQESLDEFYAAMQEAIKQWSRGETASIVRKNEDISEADLEIMKSAVERLNETIEKAAKDTPNEKSGKDGPGNNNEQKGDEEEMKIDKSKLTDAERAFLEDIEKRCGTEDGGNMDSSTADTSTPAEQILVSADQAPGSTEQTVTKSAQAKADTTEDIYKGLHPAVKAELEGLKKFREEAEERELAEIAKKYAIIGKSEDELIPLFKSLRAAGGTAYNDMIAVLDQAVDVVEKSGTFSEIGKSGHGSNENSAEAKAEAIAKKLMEDNPVMSYHQAIAKAWEDHPELLAEYDMQEGI